MFPTEKLTAVFFVLRGDVLNASKEMNRRILLCLNLFIAIRGASTTRIDVCGGLSF